MRAEGTPNDSARDAGLTQLVRLVGCGCFLLFALLLVVQPLLCVLQCSLSGHAGQYQQAGAPDDSTTLFVCHTPEATHAVALLVPPFWPATLPVALAFALLIYALRTLSPEAPASLRARVWAPPLPPPRRALPA